MSFFSMNEKRYSTEINNIRLHNSMFALVYFIFNSLALLNYYFSSHMYLYTICTFFKTLSLLFCFVKNNNCMNLQT